MNIHHLNCGTMCPYGQRLFAGSGGLGRHEIVCHCLLIEAGSDLVLIETGFGTADAAHPGRQLGAAAKVLLAARPRREETAVEQIRGLGLDPADVRHIAVTHLDLDHAGGLPDFPDARVHVFADEQRAALEPSLRERGRYRRPHFAHGPRWTPYEGGGEEWFGFESIRVMEGVDAEVALVPITGHSRGHSAVAVRDGEGWLLHCGDAYFDHREVATPPSCPAGFRLFQNIVAYDNAARKANTERLRELAANHGDEVRLLCAHDPHDLRAAGAR